MVNDNVIVISEMVKDVGESVVADTNYGVSVQVQRKETEYLIQSSRFYDRNFNCNFKLNRSSFALIFF
jgi:hypothetical protein